MKKLISTVFIVLFASMSLYGQVGWVEHPLDTNYDGAWGIYAVDMDADKDIDLITAAHEGHDLTWWENEGNGIFVEHLVDY